MARRPGDEPSAAAPEIGDDEAYDSAEDEDFQLDDAGGDRDSDVSSSEDEGEEADTTRPAKKRKLDKSPAKRKKGQDAGEDAELDSGDEVTIRKAREKKQARKAGKGKDDDDDIDFDEEDDEGGQGGFVKTRAMRMQMQEERKPLAKIDGATIDVDALWAKMNAGGTDSGLLPNTNAQDTNADNAQDAGKEQRDKDSNVKARQSPPPEKLPSDEMIKIKRTYKFAGEMITEEKLVPKDSAEAKLFLAESKGENMDVESEISTAKLRRPLRRISRFDPNPQGLIKKNWEKQPIAVDEATGPKLNTVEKSRLDWAQYVDEAGIKDELNVHSKAKEGYLGRMDFLDRVDSKREEERRNIRLRGL